VRVVQLGRVAQLERVVLQAVDSRH